MDLISTKQRTRAVTYWCAENQHLPGNRCTHSTETEDVKKDGQLMLEKACHSPVSLKQCFCVVSMARSLYRAERYGLAFVAVWYPTGSALSGYVLCQGSDWLLVRCPGDLIGCWCTVGPASVLSRRCILWNGNWCQLNKSVNLLFNRGKWLFEAIFVYNRIYERILLLLVLQKQTSKFKHSYFHICAIVNARRLTQKRRNCWSHYFCILIAS